MRFISTAGTAKPASLSKVIITGAASDGGLYVPDKLLQLEVDARGPRSDLAGFAATFLKTFLVGDALEPDLAAICAKTFDFPAPLVMPDPARPTLHSFELFHGPTGAFKDFGARFIIECFARIGGGGRPLTVLAATSGDTGGAVGCAAENRTNVRAVILYPRGRISPFQELQLTCWGSPVQAVEVDGDFDACQRLAKEAFADRELSARHRLTSANSINVGRLLPQAAYLAWGATRLFEESGLEPGLIIPTGNLGHGYAALLARALGIRIGPIVLATNANRTLKEWSETWQYRSRASLTTLANAMDVGDPSNFARLASMPVANREVQVERVEDDAIRARIRSEYDRSGYIWCPHSATGIEAFARMPEPLRSERPWLIAATAHPFKFRETVEPLIGRAIPLPPSMTSIFDRPVEKRSIAPELPALVRLF